MGKASRLEAKRNLWARPHGVAHLPHPHPASQEIQMITDKQLEWAMDILIDRESQAAKARAAHEHMSDLDKVVLAKLTNDAPSDLKSAASRETWARAHDTYENHLDQKRVLAEMDYKLRDRRSAANAIVEAWRTEQSNARASSRVG